MEKQSYLKPFMVMEKFLPQEFVAGCTQPGTYYIRCNGQTIWMENGKEEGLQANNGNYGDIQFGGGQTFWFNEQPNVRRVNKDGTYYEITVQNNYKILNSNGDNISSQYTSSINYHTLYRNSSAPYIKGPVDKNGS